MIKTGADLPIGAQGNTRGRGSDEGEAGSDEENASDEEDMDEGAAKVKVEEILFDVSAEDEEGFTKILQSPMLPIQKMIDLHNISRPTRVGVPHACEEVVPGMQQNTERKR